MILVSQDLCAPYWPDDVGKTLQFNDYTTELMDSNKFEDYFKREFKLTKETVSVLQCAYNTVILYYLSAIGQ